MLKINKYYFFIFFTAILNCELLFLTGWKRSGIPFLREVFLLTLVAIAVIYLVLKTINRKRFSRVEVLLVFFVFFGFFSPAIHSYVMYGQPIIYGLLEERRILSYLSFFPMLLLAKRLNLSQEDLVDLVVRTGFLILIVSSLYALGLIPENRIPSFMVGENNYGVNDPRYATRFPINTSYIFFVFCLAISKLVIDSKMEARYFIFVVMASIYVLLIDQGRTNILMFFFAVVLAAVKARNKLRVALYSYAVVFLAPVIFASLGALGYGDILRFFLSNSSAPIEEQVRYQTVSVILSLLRDSYFFGWGALSLQWNEGFHRLYGPNFYLSDVALFGTIFRHGWISFLVIPAYFMLLMICAKNRAGGYISSAVSITAISFLFFGFLNGKLEYAGSTIAVMLAISLLPRQKNILERVV